MDTGELIRKIEQATEREIGREEGDYIGEDGLLICGKCGTKKQSEIEIFGVKLKPFCLCRCEQERMDREEAERKQRAFEDSIKALRSAGFPDDDLRRCCFERDDHTNEKVIEVARRYVDRWEEMRTAGKGLLFYGTVGTGKSFAAACIANALIDKGVPCLMTNFARLINTLDGLRSGKQDYIDGLNKFSLLIIDDLASERDTEYAGEIVQNIIDARYRSGKPLIVTTNLTGEELKNPAEIRRQRVFSRLFEMCLPVLVDGNDRRKQKLREDYNKYQDIIGNGGN